MGSWNIDPKLTPGMKRLKGTFCHCGRVTPLASGVCSKCAKKKPPLKQCAHEDKGVRCTSMFKSSGNKKFCGEHTRV